MTIDAYDIHDYVDRYLNNYIFYHGSHFAEDVGDISDTDMANYVFGGRYQEELDIAGIGAQAQSTMFNNANKRAAAASLDIADQIANGTLLQETLDEIAVQINTAIEEQVSKIEFDKLYASALSYRNLLSNGSPRANDVRSFIRLLTYAVEQAGGYNKRFLNELRWFGRTVTGQRNFRFGGNIVESLSQSQLANLNTIQDTLIRAAEKFQQNGAVSPASFTGSIVYIFRSVLKKAIAENMVKNAFQNGEIQVDNILTSLGFKSQQGSPQRSNSDITINVINEPGLELFVSSRDTSTTIQIGTNLQVNWSDTLSTNGNIAVIAKATMGELFPASTPSHYYAYNLIAHKHQYPNEYNILRGAIAANFLKQATTNKVKKAQFLMYQGRVYPVYNIIKNICDEAMRNGGQSIIGFTMQDFQSGINTWLTRDGITSPSIELAKIRSRLVNNVMDRLIISLNYNINMLAQYIK